MPVHGAISLNLVSGLSAQRPIPGPLCLMPMLLGHTWGLLWLKYFKPVPLGPPHYLRFTQYLVGRQDYWAEPRLTPL